MVWTKVSVKYPVNDDDDDDDDGDDDDDDGDNDDDDDVFSLRCFLSFRFSHILQPQCLQYCCYFTVTSLKYM